MGVYNVWKNGKMIESFTCHNLNLAKRRLKDLNGNVLHVINGEVIDVYKNINNRVYFSHTFIKEGR
jgi:hypothetical protein